MRQAPLKPLILGCVLTLIAAAAASALFVDRQVRNIRDALNQRPAVKSGQLAPAGWGDAQTLLLVGNDQRNHTTTGPVLPHSNEMLLIRIDPNKPWISMMSIPRELWVPIQTPTGTITTRFNYAYTAGGIPLLVSTIKRILGLSVNHVVVIDFNHFQQAIDQLGCVYSTVDRRYYHVNTAYSQQYFEINLQPGYQRMCGSQALQFVSYRHGDTSIVRDSRDQDFLLDARKQLTPGLLGNIGSYEGILGRTIGTDPTLHTTDGILGLLGTVASSAGKPVRKVQFQATLLPQYDTATPQQIAASVNSFLHGANHVPKKQTAQAARTVHHRAAARKLPLAPTPAAELTAARRQARRLQFRLEFPRVIDARAGLGQVAMSTCPQDAVEVTCMRRYLIRGSGKAVYPAYVVVDSAGLLGQYYDVQGTTWTSAPLFANPDQTIRVGRRTYDLYYQGAHLRTVAWFEHGAVYWIHNTLLDSVANGVMLAIAEQTTPVLGAGAVSHVSATAGLRLRGAPGPVRPPTSVVPTTTERLGWIAGLLALLALPVALVTVIRRRRELRALRAEFHQLKARGAELTDQLDAMRSRPAPPRWTEPKYFRVSRRTTDDTPPEELSLSGRHDLDAPPEELSPSSRPTAGVPN
ncbi:MAG: LCP family protein [Solirubrobacteraceae bacterium]